MLKHERTKVEFVIYGVHVWMCDWGAEVKSYQCISDGKVFFHAAFVMFTLRIKLSLHDMAVQILNFSVYSVFLAFVVEHSWHTQIYLAALDSPRIHTEQHQNKRWCRWRSWGRTKQTRARSCICGVYEQAGTSATTTAANIHSAVCTKPRTTHLHVQN